MERTGYSTEACLRTMAFTPNRGGRMGLATMLKGPPGTGKSSIIDALCTKHGLHNETLITSLMESVDIGGYRVPDAASGYLKLYPPAFVERIVEAKKQGSVLFFDEINCAATAANLDAALRIVNDLAVGPVKLPDNCRIFAAMNPPEMTHAGHEIGMALANRFVTLEVSAEDTGSADEWIDLYTQGFNDSVKLEEKACDVEARVHEAWETVYPQYQGVIAGYISAHRSMLYQLPNVNDPQASMGWASKRSNELAGRVLAGCDIHGNTDDDTTRLLEGTIGAGPTRTLLTYLDDADLPDTAKLLDGQVKWEHDAGRIDRTIAVLTSGVSLVTQGSRRDKSLHNSRVAAMWGLLNDVASCDLSQDVIISPAKAMTMAGLWSEKAIKATSKLRALVDAIGAE